VNQGQFGDVSEADTSLRKGSTLARITLSPGRRWAVRATATAVTIGSLTAMSAGLSAQAAVPARSATVVKVVTRHPFGKMLAKVNGRSLYVLPSGSCTGGCLAAWPPLLLPHADSKGLGTSCLSTKSFMGRRQVTYRGRRLYEFAGDSGTSVNGNGVSGFKVAKFLSRACPR
jgi:predicted lipoprotein with Yx(FWY)xxD motif